MKVDLIGTLSHYRAHLQPIYDALPDDLKGKVHPKLSVAEPCDEDRVALVGGWLDVAPLRGRCKMIYVEHGAGQTYGGGDGKFKDLPGYSGSGGYRHEGVIGFIAPSEAVAARWTSAPTAAVGCPKMDPWFDGPYSHPPLEPRSVCFAWHWEGEYAHLPEMRSAWQHYKPAMGRIVERFKHQNFLVYGHAHPRWRGDLDDQMRAVGLTVLPSDMTVFATCGILIADNTSLALEFASLGRPIIWLNAPWYRRDVHHGGRFWEWTIAGHVVDSPRELNGVWLPGVLRDDPHRRRRERIVSEVYAYTDGSSSQRAADFVTSLVRAM